MKNMAVVFGGKTKRKRHPPRRNGKRLRFSCCPLACCLTRIRCRSLGTTLITRSLKTPTFTPSVSTKKIFGDGVVVSGRSGQHKLFPAECRSDIIVTRLRGRCVQVFNGEHRPACAGRVAGLLSLRGGRGANRDDRGRVVCAATDSYESVAWIAASPIFELACSICGIPGYT